MVQRPGREHPFGPQTRLNRPVPLENRVTPFGDLVAVAGRGRLMGNRGVLHDDARRIVRAWQVRRWIACLTEFRGRHREIMQPRRYTELFFLDEPTAFAAGHHTRAPRDESVNARERSRSQAVLTEERR